MSEDASLGPAGAGLGCLVVGGLFVVAPVWFFWGPVVGGITLAVIVLASFVVGYGTNQQAEADAIAKAERFVGWSQAWGAEVAMKISQGQIWVGQSREQLVAALGEPDSVDEKVLKTKVKNTYKYQETAKGKFALRVTLDDDEVVGWEDRR